MRLEFLLQILASRGTLMAFVEMKRNLNERSIMGKYSEAERHKVIKALENPKYTWRTVQGICEETTLEQHEVQEILRDLSGSTVVSARQRKTQKALFTTRDHLDRKNPTSDTKLENIAVLISDLVGSTSYKQKKGHKQGVERVFLANFLTEQMVSKNSGKVLKNLGDGLLCSFKTPLEAMLTALETNKFVTTDEQCQRLDVSLKFAITLGTVEVFSKGETIDIFGTPVDKCARISSLAKADQIIVEDAVYSSCESNVVDSGFVASDMESIGLKDFKKIGVREIAWNKESLTGIDVTKYPPFVTELYCSKCGKLITDKDITDRMITLEFDQDLNKSKKRQQVIKNLLVLHKGTCNLDSARTWRDLSDLSSPEGYLDFVLTIINLLQGEQEIWSTKAKENLFQILFRMYPFVFRQSTTKEFEEYCHNKWLLSYGL